MVTLFWYGRAAWRITVRLGDQDGHLVADMVKLIQGSYTAPQWLDVSLYEPKPNGRLYVVAVGSVAGNLGQRIRFMVRLRRLLPQA